LNLLELFTSFIAGHSRCNQKRSARGRPFTPSYNISQGLFLGKEVRGTTLSVSGVEGYMMGTKEAACYLSKLYKAVYPEGWLRNQAAFEAGHWYRDDPGPWLARAIVWKLQVKTHADDKDGSPAICFSTNNTCQSPMVLPQIGAILASVLYSNMPVMTDGQIRTWRGYPA
jgi:hypothetical protein